MLAGMSAGMTGQIPFQQRGWRCLPAYGKWNTSLLLVNSSLYQECLLVISRKHVFTLPSVSLLRVSVVHLVLPALLEVEA